MEEQLAPEAAGIVSNKLLACRGFLDLAGRQCVSTMALAYQLAIVKRCSAKVNAPPGNLPSAKPALCTTCHAWCTMPLGAGMLVQKQTAAHSLNCQLACGGN